MGGGAVTIMFRKDKSTRLGIHLQAKVISTPPLQFEICGIKNSRRFEVCGFAGQSAVVFDFTKKNCDIFIFMTTFAELCEIHGILISVAKFVV